MSERARQTPRPMSPAPTTTTRPAAQPSLVLAVGHRHCGVGERRRSLADPGLGAHPLARLQRVPEEGGEDGSRRALLLGPLERPPDLAHHLGLPGHHRLEARGHREQMGGHVVVEAHGGVRGQLLHRETGMLGEHVVDLRHGVVEAVHHGVHLGAQAGREDHGLLDVALVTERARAPCAGRRRIRRQPRAAAAGPACAGAL